MLRRDINRALRVYTDPRTPSNYKDEVLAGIAYLFAADQAYVNSNVLAAQFLHENGAQLIDIGLGVIPVVGSINDGANIVHGLITGHDIAGQRMERADYLLRGAGIVLGLVPGSKVIGKLAAESITVGGQTLSRATVRGANTIRELGLGNRVAAISTKAGSAKLAEHVANYAGHLPGELAQMTAREKQLLKSELDTLSSQLAKVEVKEVTTGAILNEAMPKGKTPAHLDRLPAFKVEVKEGETFLASRVHSNIDNGNRPWLMLEDPRTMTKAEIADRFALPGGEININYSSTLVLPPGTKMNISVARPAVFSSGVQRPGGGLQIEVIEPVPMPRNWVRETKEFP